MYDAYILTADLTSTSLDVLENMDIYEFVEYYKSSRRRKSEVNITALNIQSLPYISKPREQKKILESVVDQYMDEGDLVKKRATDKKAFARAFSGK